MMQLESAGRAVTVYGENTAKNVIWMHTFSDEGAAAFAMLPPEMQAETTLVTIAMPDPDWNAQLSPWEAPALFKKEPPFAGNADTYLHILTDSMMPEILAQAGLSPQHNLIAGYSLAGLFALYALWNTDRFHGGASISGSLWYPGFSAYLREKAPERKPDFVYLSLGDRECRARNPLLASVQEKTEEIAALLRNAGIPAVFELNPGGHTNQAAERTGKALMRLILQYNSAS